MLTPITQRLGTVMVKATGGMMAARLKSSSEATAILWYSAWDAAGKPNLQKMVGEDFPKEEKADLARDLKLRKEFKLVPEGRLLYNPTAAANPRSSLRWLWEYHLRDHLGNLRLAVRMPLTDNGEEIDDSFEHYGLRATAGTGANVGGPCQRVDAVRQRLPLRARTGEHVVVLGGTAPGMAARVVGPVLTRPVAAGDSVYAAVWGSYNAPLRPARFSSPLLPGPDPSPEAGAPRPVARWLPRLRLQLTGLLAAAHRDAGAAMSVALPVAYLKLSLYSQDSLKVAEQRAYLTMQAAPQEWQELRAKLKATENGYLKVELFGESPQPAYFDDLMLRLVKERGMQENHYDP